MNKKMTEYISSLLPDNKEWVNKIEQQAKEEFIPIMDPIGMNFLMQIIRMVKPNEILEIGTAIGYSALRMNDAYPSAKITTIEQDEQRVKKASDYIVAQNKTNLITVLHGDALEHMGMLVNEQKLFELIFIDAAKSKYKQFFERAVPLLAKDGIIVTDNILFKGYVFNNEDTHPRHQKLAKKIDVFNRWLAEHPHFVTSFVPIGDGVAISMKIK